MIFFMSTLGADFAVGVAHGNWPFRGVDPKAEGEFGGETARPGLLVAGALPLLADLSMDGNSSSIAKISSSLFLDLRDDELAEASNVANGWYNGLCRPFSGELCCGVDNSAGTGAATGGEVEITDALKAALSAASSSKAT